MKKKIEQVDNGNNVQGLYDSLLQVQSQLTELKKQEAVLKSELTFIYKDKMKEEYAKKAEPFGVVNFSDGDTKVSFTTAKKVTYDQKGLKEVHDNGGPVTVEYGIPESVYKVLDEDLKKYLLQYRTVEAGSISIKVEKEESDVV